jgi:hypothetical protein
MKSEQCNSLVPPPPNVEHAPELVVKSTSVKFEDNDIIDIGNGITIETLIR